MTATGQAELTDYHRAQAAKAKAARLFPREIARALTAQLDAGINYPGFTDRARWRRLIDEITKLPER